MNKYGARFYGEDEDEAADVQGNDTNLPSERPTEARASPGPRGRQVV